MATFNNNPGTEAGKKELNEFLAARSYVSGFAPSKADASVFAEVTNKVCSKQFPHLARWAKHVASFSPCARKSWAGQACTVPGASIAASSAPAADAPSSSTGAIDQDLEDEDIGTYMRFLAANKDEWSGDDGPGDEAAGGQTTGAIDQEQEDEDVGNYLAFLEANKDDFVDEPEAGSGGTGDGDGDPEDLATYLRFLEMNKDEWSDEEEEQPKYAPGSKRKVQTAILTLELTPEDSEVDMKKIEDECKKIELPTLDWHGASMVPFVFGMHKLQIVCQVHRTHVKDNLPLTSRIEKIAGVADVAVINEEQTRVTVVEPDAPAKGKGKKKKSNKGKKKKSNKGKKGKPEKVKFALVHIELMPDGSDTKWSEIEKKVKAIKYDGIDKWGNGVEHDLAFGLTKLRISAQVVRGTETGTITQTLEAMPEISDVMIIGVEEI